MKTKITEQEHRELLEVSQKVVMAIAHKKYLVARSMVRDWGFGKSLIDRLEAVVERLTA